MIRRIAADDNFARATGCWRWGYDDVTQADTGAKDGILPKRRTSGLRGYESRRAEIRLAFYRINRGVSGAFHRFKFFAAVINAAAFSITGWPSKGIHGG